MTSQLHATAGCLLVGDYVDEGEPPAYPAGRQAEVVRPNVVANHLDLWGRDDGLREFTVLMKDGRVLAVRGHALRHEPHAIAGQDVFSIIVRTTTEEILVGLFKSMDVSGIFHGDLRLDRKIA